MKIRTCIIAAAVSMALTGVAQAAPTADEIKQLGTTLTPWGADKAGNKDGTYPAYTGGMKKTLKEAFPNEKPVLTIDAKNLAQYADKLTLGEQELMKRYPTFQMHIYPTHRTYWMDEPGVKNTLKNAANPECKTVADGLGVRGCWAGIPFPIAKTGYEVMWNHFLRERKDYQSRYLSYVVDTSGAKYMTADTRATVEFPYWDPNQKPYDGDRGIHYQRFITETIGPARDAGTKVVIWYPIKGDIDEQKSWSYSTGQRRVRLAPEFTYDTPAVTLSGALNYDEIGGGFSGRMDRFDFKLVGKKEFYLPYSQDKFFTMDAEKLLGKQNVNPDAVRYELRRAWVVEATRKPGKRHMFAKRTFYLDEDNWGLLATESIDDAGKISRMSLTSNFNIPTGGTADASSSGQYYDLARGMYLAIGVNLKLKQPMSSPDVTFRPEAMSGTGVR